jgi:hypothetical protein
VARTLPCIYAPGQGECQPVGAGRIAGDADMKTNVSATRGTPERIMGSWKIV